MKLGFNCSCNYFIIFSILMILVFILNYYYSYFRLELYDAELPGRYRDSVRCIRPGMLVFLYNFDDGNRKLYGVYKVSYY